MAIGQPRYCYNIFDRSPQFDAKYGVLVLFDVLEHIEKGKEFLKMVLFHLKLGGYLLIKVPAFMILHSLYDEVMGHQRCYGFEMLERACSTFGLTRSARTSWGSPMLPLLLLRKFWLRREQYPHAVTRRGFTPPGRVANFLLGGAAKLEIIPQRLIGNLLANYQKG
jgi:hypothetical protein